MRKRVFTLIIGVLIFLLIFYLDSLELVNGAIFFNIAMAVCAFLMNHEFYSALEEKGFKPIKVLGHLCVLFILPIGVVQTKTLMMICASIIPLIIFIGMTISVLTKLKYNIVDISVTLLGAIYTVLMVAFLSATRAMSTGVFLIFYIFCGAWFSDIFAFLVGKAIGKHKFSTISPKKSIEGCIGGLIGTVLFFIIYSLVLHQLGICEGPIDQVFLTNIPMQIALAIIVSIVSQIGDLAASAIKRYAEIKDFSHLMPGHGGMLDRFDSVLFVAPIIYYAFYIIMHI
jgi:phosphatidate cytidylyltransferase